MVGEEGGWRWVGVWENGGEVNAIGGGARAVGESDGLLHAFFGCDGGCVFVLAGGDGREGGGVVVVREVAAAHDVGCPDESGGVEGDVALRFPGVDALREVVAVETEGVCFRNGIADEGAQAFEGGDEVVGGHAGAGGEVGDAEGGGLLEEGVGEDEAPVVAVGDEAHV